MGRRPGLGLTFYFLSYDLHWGCDGRHTEVDSPTDRGGGKRRPGIGGRRYRSRRLCVILDLGAHTDYPQPLARAGGFLLTCGLSCNVLRHITKGGGYVGSQAGLDDQEGRAQEAWIVDYAVNGSRQLKTFERKKDADADDCSLYRAGSRR